MDGSGIQIHAVNLQILNFGPLSYGGITFLNLIATLFFFVLFLLHKDRTHTQRDTTQILPLRREPEVPPGLEVGW